MSSLVDLSPLDYIKHASDTTYKDYFPIPKALEYTLKYWKWTEDVLKYYESILKKIHIQDSIFSCIFTCDWQMNVICFFL